MSKIVLAQINTIAGDVESNFKKISDCLVKAQEQKADLIIFPEFALVGYPFGNILKRHKSIIKKQSKVLDSLKKHTNNITAVIGYADENSNSSIAVIKNGEIISSGKSIKYELNGEVFLVNPLEDEIKTIKPHTVINCSNMPSRQGCEFKRNALFSSIVKKYNVNYIYVNQACYSDNYCFDGLSRVYDNTGKLTARAMAFSEDFLVTENLQGKINDMPIGMEKEINFNEFNISYTDDLARTYHSIVFGIREYFKKNGFSKAVLGLSGGLDSTVSAVLLADALGKENVYGISMPSRITSDTSKNDAKLLVEKLGINFMEVPLAPALDVFKIMFNNIFEKIKTDKYEKSTTIENLQARTRATILWSVSNEYKGMLPIATSDKSEAYIGYATVNGDMSGGFAPIADVTKTKLFALGAFLNQYREEKNVIPQSVLEKPPGAELKINPKTGKTVCAEEDNMPYEFLDEIIWYVENFGYGYDELINHSYLYEKKHNITESQKEEWIKKFYWKSKVAIYKWHIMPSSIVIDNNSINSVEYRQPVISKVY